MQVTQHLGDFVRFAVEIDAFGDRQTHTVLRDSLPGTKTQVLAKGVFFVRHHDADVASALFDEPFNRQAHEGLVVEIDEGMRRHEIGAAVGDERKVVLEKVARPVVKTLRPREDNGIGQRVPADVADSLKAVLPETVGRDVDGVSGTGEPFIHAAEKLGGKAQKLVTRIEHEVDDLGPAGPQSLGSAVGYVSQPVGNFANSFSCAFRNSGIVGERARHRRHRDASLGGNRAQGRAHHRVAGAFVSGIQGLSRHARSPQPKACSSTSPTSLIREFKSLQQRKMLHRKMREINISQCKKRDNLFLKQKN